MDYAICQINGKQYKVIPGKVFEIDKVGEGINNLSVKVLLVSKDKSLEIGTPFLKDDINLNVLGSIKGKKIRVAKFHAKANYRKVTGQRSQKTQVIFNVKKS